MVCCAALYHFRQLFVFLSSFVNDAIIAALATDVCYVQRALSLFELATSPHHLKISICILSSFMAIRAFDRLFQAPVPWPWATLALSQFNSTVLRPLTISFKGNDRRKSSPSSTD